MLFIGEGLIYFLLFVPSIVCKRVHDIKLRFYSGEVRLHKRVPIGNSASVFPRLSFKVVVDKKLKISDGPDVHKNKLGIYHKQEIPLQTLYSLVFKVVIHIKCPETKNNNFIVKDRHVYV